MDTTNDNLMELHTQHRELSRQLHDAVLGINSLRVELHSDVLEVRQMIHPNLSYLPCPMSPWYKKKFGEHWRSFELFSDKIDIAQQQLSAPFDLSVGLLEQPDGVDEDVWEDAIDDMEEVLDKLRIGRVERKQLMTVIELVDSAERFAGLVIPSANGKGKKFIEALQIMQRTANEIVDFLMEVLAGQGVSKVDLSIGQYPPPETTRIISRNDSNSDDNVIVEEIMLNGYMWQDKLLRKADVIVTSNEGE